MHNFELQIRLMCNSECCSWHTMVRAAQSMLHSIHRNSSWTPNNRRLCVMAKVVPGLIGWQPGWATLSVAAQATWDWMQIHAGEWQLAQHVTKLFHKARKHEQLLTQQKSHLVRAFHK